MENIKDKVLRFWQSRTLFDHIIQYNKAAYTRARNDGQDGLAYTGKYGEKLDGAYLLSADITDKAGNVPLLATMELARLRNTAWLSNVRHGRPVTRDDSESYAARKEAQEKFGWEESATAYPAFIRLLTWLNIIPEAGYAGYPTLRSDLQKCTTVVEMIKLLAALGLIPTPWVTAYSCVVGRKMASSTPSISRQGHAIKKCQELFMETLYDLAKKHTYANLALADIVKAMAAAGFPSVAGSKVHLPSAPDVPAENTEPAVPMQLDLGPAWTLAADGSPMLFLPKTAKFIERQDGWLVLLDK